MSHIERPPPDGASPALGPPCTNPSNGPWLGVGRYRRTAPGEGYPALSPVWSPMRRFGVQGAAQPFVVPPHSGTGGCGRECRFAREIFQPRYPWARRPMVPKIATSMHRVITRLSPGTTFRDTFEPRGREFFRGSDGWSCNFAPRSRRNGCNKTVLKILQP